MSSAPESTIELGLRVRSRPAQFSICSQSRRCWTRAWRMCDQRRGTRDRVTGRLERQGLPTAFRNDGRVPDEAERQVTALILDATKMPHTRHRTVDPPLTGRRSGRTNRRNRGSIRSLRTSRSSCPRMAATLTSWDWGMRLGPHCSRCWSSRRIPSGGVLARGERPNGSGGPEYRARSVGQLREWNSRLPRTVDLNVAAT